MEMVARVVHVPPHGESSALGENVTDTLAGGSGQKGIPPPPLHPPCTPLAPPPPSGGSLTWEGLPSPVHSAPGHPESCGPPDSRARRGGAGGGRGARGCGPRGATRCHGPPPRPGAHPRA
ncbi:uncharacterized protein LOC144324296 [Canis aureus]